MYCIYFIFVIIFANAISAKVTTKKNLKDATINADEWEKFGKLRLDEKNFDKIQNLHKNSYYTAVKSLIGHFGKLLYQKLPQDQKKFLSTCLDRIDDRRELILPARCLINSRRYYLNSAPNITPFLLTKKISSARLKKYSKKNRKNKAIQSVARAKREIYPAMDKSRQEITIYNLAKEPPKSERSIIQKVTRLIDTFVGPKKINPKNSATWDAVYPALLSATDSIKKWKNMPGAKVYDKRMYDIVLDKEEASLTPSERRSPLGLIQHGLEILDTVTNNSKSESRGFRALSPRFLPLMPDSAGPNKSNFLSPTVFALYNDSNSLVSVPELMSKSGINKNDQSSILSLLMDVSGTTKHVDTALNILNELNVPDIGKPIVDTNNRITESFKTLSDSFSFRQNDDLEDYGFTFLKKKQVQKLIEDQGADKSKLDLSHFDYYDSLSRSEMELSIWKTIERIAMNDTSTMIMKNSQKLSKLLHTYFKVPVPPRRRKRDAIFVLAPVILAPYILAPTSGLSILGPLVLSPTVLSPPILNPSVLSPWILSPGVIDPFILSPYIFGPFILGPFVLTPFILSPYALSPNVINPYVLSPTILNPIILSPDILSPMVLGGGILSPSALSPAILTETFLMASVLSPTILS